MQIIHEEKKDWISSKPMSFSNLVYRLEDSTIHNFNVLGTGTTIVSQKPSRRMITHSSGRHDSRWFSDMYYLSFPNVLFSIRWAFIKRNFYERPKYGFQIMRFAFTDESNKILFYPSLQNVRVNLTVCTGLQNLIFSSKEELIQNVINSFWSYSFNEDISACLHLYKENNILSSYKNWAAYSKQNPSWYPSELVTVHPEYAHMKEFVTDYDITRCNIPRLEF